MSRATYLRAHFELRRDRGPASAQVCPCGQQARDWAFDEPTGFSFDQARYTALCGSCHSAQDGKRPDTTNDYECRRGHERTPENTYISPTNGKRQCRDCLKLSHASYRERQCQS